MEDSRKVAVIAGTPVDTQMGVDFINRKNRQAGASAPEPVYIPAASDCDAQIRFQYSDEAGKRMLMDAIFGRAEGEGISDFFIYCNSLSGAFDFDGYALERSADTERNIHIYTPLQVYRSLGSKYGRIGVLAANNLSAHAIEEALMSSNPHIYVVGTGNMAVVRAIEDGYTPSEVVTRCGLEQAAGYMEACGAEAILLGCTHFPYFRDELARLTSLPVIDPADDMYAALTARSA